MSLRPVILSEADVSVTATAIDKYYGPRRHAHPALKAVSLEVTSRSSIGIVGESGSGKSTLSRILCGLESPSHGTVTLDGSPIAPLIRSTEGNRALRRIVQYVPQDTSSSFDPRHSLREAVERPARTLLGLDRSAARDRTDQLFDALGLPTILADRRPSQVSGGQRQRFALARALVVEPRVLVCDEVVSALDVSVQGAILNLIKTMCAQRRCGLVFVSHGLPATAFVTEEMIVMRNGEFVERGTSHQIVHQPDHPYTQSLIEAYRTPLAG